MTILVIGGSKFIGWRFVELLGKTGHTVTLINRGNHQRAYPGNVTHHVAGRNDYDKMLAVVENAEYDAVFDMCGYVESDMWLHSSHRLPTSYEKEDVVLARI
jgi:2'-hydroxyisoflavone reductase